MKNKGLLGLLLVVLLNSVSSYSGFFQSMVASGQIRMPYQDFREDGMYDSKHLYFVGGENHEVKVDQ